jgi:hypothetical protein
MNPLTLSEMLTTEEFQAGLGWGVIGLAAMTILARRPFPRPWWGGITAAAVALAAQAVGGAPLGMTAALPLLYAGGELMYRSRGIGRKGFGWILILAGSALVTFTTGIDEDWWLVTGTLLFISVGGWTMARVDQALGGSGAPVAMVAASVFGIWATVPETEIPRILLGASAGTFLAGWPLRRAQIGPGGSFAVAATMAWAIGIGGELRSASIAGAWATIGAFSFALVSKVPHSANTTALLVLHVVAVFFASRVAGLQQDAYWGLAIALVTLAVTILAAKAIVSSWAVPEGNRARPRHAHRAK